MSKVITPTVGRKVWFRPNEDDAAKLGVFDLKQPCDATVIYVWSDRMVNLAVVGPNGAHFTFTSVPLAQEGDNIPQVSSHAEWMPYQVGQAKKHEGEKAAPAVEPSAGTMDFGDAIRALKAGKRVARSGWNGKGMWLSLSCGETRDVPAAGFWSPHNRAHAEASGGSAKVLPSITMKTATGEILMGWLASQTDMLAEDWLEV